MAFTATDALAARSEAGCFGEDSRTKSLTAEILARVFISWRDRGQSQAFAETPLACAPKAVPETGNLGTLNNFSWWKSCSSPSSSQKY